MNNPPRAEALEQQIAERLSKGKIPFRRRVLVRGLRVGFIIVTPKSRVIVVEPLAAPLFETGRGIISRVQYYKHTTQANKVFFVYSGRNGSQPTNGLLNVRDLVPLLNSELRDDLMEKSLENTRDWRDKELFDREIGPQYFSCFISYSTKDEDFAQQLHSDLEKKGVRCWLSSSDVKGGIPLHRQVDEAILKHQRVLLILSMHSMNSEWVKTEIATARKLEDQQNKLVLFPLRLVSFDAIRNWELFDADSGTDWARKIREFYIPDFSNWKNQDDYRREFDRLLKDLAIE